MHHAITDAAAALHGTRHAAGCVVSEATEVPAVVGIEASLAGTQIQHHCGTSRLHINKATEDVGDSVEESTDSDVQTNER